VVALQEALELGADLGDGRVKNTDEQGIHMQAVSYSSLAQLAPAGQAVALNQAANNRLAEAIAANPAGLSGFAVPIRLIFGVLRQRIGLSARCCARSVAGLWPRGIDDLAVPISFGPAAGATQS
jgi:hypothetical protein